MLVKNIEGEFKSFYRKGILKATLIAPLKLASTYTYLCINRREKCSLHFGRKNPDYIGEVQIAEAQRGRKHGKGVEHCSWCGKSHTCNHRNSPYFVTFAIQYLDGITQTAWGELLAPGIIFTASICSPMDVPSIREGAKLANIRLRSPHACAHIPQSEQEKEIGRHPFLNDTTVVKFLRDFPFTPYELKNLLQKKIGTVEEITNANKDQSSLPISNTKKA